MALYMHAKRVRAQLETMLDMVLFVKDGTTVTEASMVIVAFVVGAA